MIDWLLPLATFSLNSRGLFRKFLIFLELFDKRASNFNKYQWKIATKLSNTIRRIINESINNDLNLKTWKNNYKRSSFRFNFFFFYLLLYIYISWMNSLSLFFSPPCINKSKSDLKSRRENFQLYNPPIIYKGVIYVFSGTSINGSRFAVQGQV